MPITWTIEHDLHLVLFAVSDPYTMDEWRDAATAILSAPIPPMPLLVDRRQSEPLTTHAVDDIVRFLAEHHTAVAARRVAILVEDDANFGMGRMTELRAVAEIPQAAIRTVRTYDDAISWLAR
jgi:hypothetical protein